MNSIINVNTTDVSFKRLNLTYSEGTYLGYTVLIMKDTFINATRLCRSIPNRNGATKQPSDWTRLKSTEELLSHIETSKGVSRKDIMLDNSNASIQFRGTYLHFSLVPSFMQWLSPIVALTVSEIVNRKMNEDAQVAIKVEMDKIIEEKDCLLEVKEQTIKSLLAQMKIQHDQIMQKHDDLSMKIEETLTINHEVKSQNDQLLQEVSEIKEQNETLQEQSKIAEQHAESMEMRADEMEIIAQETLDKLEEVKQVIEEILPMRVKKQPQPYAEQFIIMANPKRTELNLIRAQQRAINTRKTAAMNQGYLDMILHTTQSPNSVDIGNRLRAQLKEAQVFNPRCIKKISGNRITLGTMSYTEVLDLVKDIEDERMTC